MKKLFFLGILLSLFLFIFLKSNTWQITQTIRVKDHIEYYQTTHSIHWDRFFAYAKDMPKYVYASISAKLNSFFQEK